MLYEPVHSILGNHLTDTTSVIFHGKAKNFKVVRGSEIKTTVAKGATAGTVEVTTSKKIRSNVVFRVTNQHGELSPGATTPDRS